MNTYISTKEELQTFIDQAVRKAFSEAIPEINSQNKSKEFLTKQELIKLTGWSGKTIQNMRIRRQIPFVQHGRKILYPYDGIMAFMKANHVKPVRE